jgi:putative transposase
MRPRGTKKQLEIRRRTAVVLRQHGLTVRAIAKQMKCAPASVARWTQAWEAKGEEGLDSKPQFGSKPRLSPAQKVRLWKLIVAGPRAAGWGNDLWTLSRIAVLIEREFGVHYHISHVHRLMHALELSPQKPARLARERDDEKVAEFRAKTWPAIKKKPKQRTVRSS